MLQSSTAASSIDPLARREPAGYRLPAERTPAGARRPIQRRPIRAHAGDSAASSNSE